MQGQTLLSKGSVRGNAGIVDKWMWLIHLVTCCIVVGEAVVPEKLSLISNAVVFLLSFCALVSLLFKGKSREKK